MTSPNVEVTRKLTSAIRRQAEAVSEAASEVSGLVRQRRKQALAETVSGVLEDNSYHQQLGHRIDRLEDQQRQMLALLEGLQAGMEDRRDAAPAANQSSPQEPPTLSSAVVASEPALTSSVVVGPLERPAPIARKTNSAKKTGSRGTPARPEEAPPVPADESPPRPRPLRARGR